MPDTEANTEATFDEYDHDFEPFELCAGCNETHEDCDCEEFVAEEQDDVDECNNCGLPKADATHGDMGN